MSDGKAIEHQVVYVTPMAARRRVVRFLLLKHPVLRLMTAGIAFCGGAFAAVQAVGAGIPAAILAFLLAAASSLLSYYALQLGALRLYVWYGKTGKAIHTELTRDGVRDGADGAERLLPWSRISQVREHDGDVYFLFDSASCYVPREAFQTDEQRDAFLSTARELWEADRSTTPHIRRLLRPAASPATPATRLVLPAKERGPAETDLLLRPERPGGGSDTQA